MPASNRKRILIVGGGFAGVFTAMHLETQLRKAKLVDAVETVLVNKRQQPRSHIRVRFPVEQNVEHDVRVEKHLHRCLSSRWRR